MNATENQKPGLKIKTAKVENFRKIKLVELKPEQNFIAIAGKNANGKTSLLDGIACALSGQKPDFKRTVHDGAEKSEVTIELTNGIKIVQRETNTGSYSLKVTTADGGVMTAGSTFLGRFYNSIQFDPLDFSRKQPKDQVEALKKMVALDFTELDFEKRTKLDKAKEAKARLDVMTAKFNELPEDLDQAPDEEVSISELNKSRDEILDHNRKVGASRDRFSLIASSMKAKEERLEELAREMKLIAQACEAEANEAKELETYLKTEIEKPYEAIDEQIKNSESTNFKVRLKKTVAEKRLEFAAVALEEKEASDRAKAIDAEKKKLLEDAQFPIAGLAFDSEDVLFNGMPLKECSSSERLRVCLAIAKATRSEMSVLLIRDGSLLDEDALTEVQKFAEDNDCQILLEVVGENVGDEAIIIEGGLVKGQQVPLI
jgi:predicted ATP-dependent endonuclease of OLD family